MQPSKSTHQPNRFFSQVRILLDDLTATIDQPRSRLYTGFVEESVCTDARQFDEFFRRQERFFDKGLYAVLVCDYEFGEQIIGLEPFETSDNGRLRLLWFQNVEHLSSEQVHQLLNTDSGMPGGMIDLEQNITSNEYMAAIHQIKEHIKKGDTYQVNYSYRLKFTAFGEVTTLYRRLRAVQPAAFGALITLPDQRVILSFSPELFVRHTHGRLTTKPIKGTCSGSEDPETREVQARALVADEKIRAENLMIVDLLRNDLAKIAETGSLEVEKLFEVESFGAMLQVVSTIGCDLSGNVRFPEVFEALFPCGSITGAPKRSTMEIIRELEPECRGIYTGAIGWIDPPGPHQSMGDFALSVAIRTLSLSAPEPNGTRRGMMGVGGGILYDSDPDLEYEEARLKSGFLTTLDPGFSLIETMYGSPGEGIRYQELHLKRLSASARRFDFKYDAEQIHLRIQQFANDLPAPSRIRLTLNYRGELELTRGAYSKLESPVRVMISPQRVHSTNPFLAHKTTVRKYFDDAICEAEVNGCFDLLFTNERGELTEGARSNLFVRLSGNWYTPPLSSGLLPGVMREVLLNDPMLNASERILMPHDLQQAEEVFVCNSLRGRVSVEIFRTGS
jgi:para-aminobenzoate synthetase / 4-amino-4-deoxychorismate lyase